MEHTDNIITRKIKIFTLEDDDGAITLMYPMSGEHDKKLILIFEDAYGEVDMRIMSAEVISTTYNVNLKEIEVFIDENIKKN